tara:strand:- start:462 stop:620 length:159 start_codon:yes stop_codon:yes gene_type:complete
MTEQHARYIADYIMHEIENGLNVYSVDSEILKTLIIEAMDAINGGAMEGYTQ